MNLVALKTEIQTDPAGLGYAGKNDADIASILNEVRNAVEFDRDTVYSYEIFEAIDSADWTAVSPPAHLKQAIQMLISAGTVNLRGSNTRATLAAAFGPGTQTRTNILLLQKRKGSRAEFLFGEGVRVSHLDVAKARVA